MGPLDPTPLDLQPSSKIDTLNLQTQWTQCLDTMYLHNVSDTMAGHNVAMWQCTVRYSTVQYNTVQYSTVQYSTCTVQYSTVQYSIVKYSKVHGESTVKYSKV